MLFGDGVIPGPQHHPDSWEWFSSFLFKEDLEIGSPGLARGLSHPTMVPTPHLLWCPFPFRCALWLVVSPTKGVSPKGNVLLLSLLVPGAPIRRSGNRERLRILEQEMEMSTGWDGAAWRYPWLNYQEPFWDGCYSQGKVCSLHPYCVPCCDAEFVHSI